MKETLQIQKVSDKEPCLRSTIWRVCIKNHLRKATPEIYVMEKHSGLFSVWKSGFHAGEGLS